MNRRLVILLLLLGGMLVFSGCSDEARYNRYIKSSIRAKEKRQKKWRKEMEKQNREQFETLRDAESATPRVSIQ